MNRELIDNITTIIVFCTLPGCAGGIVSFLSAFKRGHFRNDRYIAKLCIEILGAAITTSFLISIIVSESRYQVPVAFATGIGWSSIVQLIRAKITKYVEVTLGQKLKEGDD